MNVREEAAVIIETCGRYHGEGNQGHNYSAMYNGKTFYSDCTSELAEKIAAYIGDNPVSAE